MENEGHKIQSKSNKSFCMKPFYVIKRSGIKTWTP
jgi:hypothetical protein